MTKSIEYPKNAAPNRTMKTCIVTLFVIVLIIGPSIANDDSNRKLNIDDILFGIDCQTIKDCPKGYYCSVSSYGGNCVLKYLD